ncbi:hypothetical protein H072_10074 [Dactylellina haptotyla CBS 200.50]|uniref:Uncharacterized protein n=1 Tax=Dactylellina haptotyla (strain CBS 200.50) TaxID=1284197 RepID=S8BB71_DACHA|nr:hypothetical protein H072_10074 [Dactylellina haptotyla CBS 200.50]
MLSKKFKSVFVSVIWTIFRFTNVEARPATGLLPAELKARLASNPVPEIERLVSAQGLKKRHALSDPHMEIIFNDPWPTNYNVAFFNIFHNYIQYSYDSKSFDGVFGRQIEVEAQGCRPIYASCAGNTFLQVCSRASTKQNFKGEDVWHMVRRMMSVKLTDIWNSVPTFRLSNDNDVEPASWMVGIFDKDRGPHLAAVKTPLLDKIVPTMVGATYWSAGSDIAIGWYFGNPDSTNKDYLKTYGLECNNVPIAGHKADPEDPNSVGSIDFLLPFNRQNENQH